MRRAVIVIGCSYGDEGKGLAASWAAGQMETPVLNVLINGGAQRGHTVDLPDGRRHIFHHFGSAALRGAVSYADEDFLVNPLLWMQEKNELARDFGICPALVISDRCRVSTPWDMMTGQIIEESRGKKRHGSCGCGIFETQVRYRNTDWALRWNELRGIRKADYLAYCRRIAEEYLPGRLAEMGAKPDSEWNRAIRNPKITEAAWLDLQEMAAGTDSCRDWKTLAADYPALIFEAGQGLALDACNTSDFPFLTPSRTTSRISAERIAGLPGKTESEILYVTRTYLTRHGAGPFPTECPREGIGRGIRDRTNLPNPHQKTLRYGLFDGPAVLERVKADLEETRTVLSDVSTAVMVTHLNETNREMKGNMKLKDFVPFFDRAYLSDSPWNVQRLNEPVCKNQSPKEGS